MVAVRDKAALARASDEANKPLCRDMAASTAKLDRLQAKLSSLLVKNLYLILEGLYSARAITLTEAAATVFATQELAKVADERHRHEAAAAAKALAAQVLAAALAKEPHCQEVAALAVQASAEALAKERRCQEVAARAAQALTEASEAAAHAAALAAQASTDKRPPQMVCRRV